MHLPNWVDQSSILEAACVSLGASTTRLDDITFHARYQREAIFRRTSSPPEGAARVVNHKGWTKRLLMDVGILMPRGLTYRAPVSAVDGLQYPLVVKPVAWQFGGGVTTRVETGVELRTAMKYALRFGRIKRVLVEERIEGVVYRLFMISERLVDAIRIDPPNVTGDGHSTIARLMLDKSKARENLPDSYPLMETFNLDMLSVPRKGEVVMLSDLPHRSLGGDYYTVTADTAPVAEFERIGRIAHRVLGLPVAGIDVIVDDDGRVWTLECNAYPLFSVHLHPTRGKPVPVDELIARYFLT